MSIQSYEEAMDRVLSAEFAARDDIVLMRMGAYPALAQGEREICLPREIEEFGLSLALGAALAGCHAVLDLRSASGATLSGALKALPVPCPKLTILLAAPQDGAWGDDLPLRRFLPRTPRQAAGFTRAALRMDEAALLAVDKSQYDELEDVPDDEDFVLMPAEEEQKSATLPAVQADTAADDSPDAAPCDAMDAESADANAGELDAPGEEDADEHVDIDAQAEEEPPAPMADEAAASREDKPVMEMICLSARRVPFDAGALGALCVQLGAPAGHIKQLCIERVRAESATPFEWVDESSALPGECAYLAPTAAAALLWLGADEITITYNAQRLPHADAARLLRSAQRLLQNPLLLLYDSEHENA